MNHFVDKLKRNENLTAAEMNTVMQQIMSGDAREQEIADFLLALNLKGPTVDEITGAARLLQRFYQPVTTRHAVVLDTCGTGGDKKNTFNISTLTALVVAGAGVVVAKHGNRSVSSKCGSADILEALGVNLTVEHDRLSACLDEVGIAFLFAQKLHPAMKNVAPVRRALGVETIFNILGPLINPARATHQIMGVYSRDLVEPMARVLKNLGLRRALVVHGADGLDEVTTTDKTFVCEWTGTEIKSYDVDPEEFGLVRPAETELQGGDFKTNMRITREILTGCPGPRRDIVILNAAYALYTVGRVDSVTAGMTLAAQSIDSGQAEAKLAALIEFSNRDT